MAKILPIEKIIEALKHLTIEDKLKVAKSNAELIADEERAAQELIDKANATISLIQKGGE